MGFVRVVPIVPAGSDFAAAISFYVEKLGFEKVWEQGGFAGLRSGPAEIMLQDFGDAQFCSNYMVRVQVDNIDEYYEVLRSKGFRGLGKLETKPWGSYEFHVIDPAGVCIHFFR